MKLLINYTLTLFLCMTTSCIFYQKDEEQPLSEDYENMKAEALMDEANKFYHNKEYKKAEILYNKVIILAEELEYHGLLADCYYIKGALFYLSYNYEASVLSYKRANKIYLSLGNKIRAGNTYRNLGQAYKKLTIHDEALRCFFKALKLIKKEGNEKKIASCYNLIANIHTDLGDYETSISYHEKALKLRKKIAYKSGIAGSLNNIGLSHLENKDFDEALKYLNHALIIKANIGNKNLLAPTFSLIGEVYLNKKDYQLAEKYFLKAFQLRFDKNDKNGIMVTANKLGRLYVETSDLDKAKKYLNTANRLANEMQSKRELANNHKYYKNLNLFEKNYSEALKHSEEYIKISDQILDEKKSHSIISSRIKFEVDRISQEIKIQKQRVVTLTQHKTVLIAGSTMAVIIAILFYFLLQQKKKSESRVQQLLKDTHHRVKNSLQALSGMVSYQAFQLKNQPEAKEVLSDIENRMRAIIFIHKRLCQPKEEALADISFKDYIYDVVHNLRITYGFTNSKLKLIFDVDDINIDVEKAIPLGLIINELVTNSFKYAFHDHDQPMLNIEVKKMNNHLLHLKVQDNGTGLPEDFENRSESSGMLILKDMVRDLKSHLMVTNENGACFELNISV